MRTDYITPEAWKQVQTRYPGAFFILLKSSLETEKKMVKLELERPSLEPLRRKWLTERLEDLTRFDNDTPA